MTFLSDLGLESGSALGCGVVDVGGFVLTVCGGLVVGMLPFECLY